MIILWLKCLPDGFSAFDNFGLSNFSVDSFLNETGPIFSVLHNGMKIGSQPRANIYIWERIQKVELFGCETEKGGTTNEFMRCIGNLLEIRLVTTACVKAHLYTFSEKPGDY